MIDPVKKIRHPLERVIRDLGIQRTEIARRHSCTPQFIHAVFQGNRRCPPALDRLIRQMIADRIAAANQVLRDFVLDPSSAADMNNVRDAL